MKLQTAVSVFEVDFKEFGFRKASFDLLLKAINQIVYFKIMQCMTIEKVDPKFLLISPEYTFGFASEEEILRDCEDPENQLKREFVVDALSKGDKCFAIRQDGKLASYGWYASGSTRLTSDLILKFNADHTYMYNGYTHPNHRGKRLHAIGMTMALKEFRDGGSNGLVSNVEVNNYRSLNSVYRMGYLNTGKIYILRVMGRYFIYVDNSNRQKGFSIEVKK